MTTADPAHYIRVLANHGHLCLLCGKTSKNKHNMMRHVRSLHIAVRDLTCVMCASTFTTENNRQIHYRKNHNLQLSLKEIAALEADTRQLREEQQEVEEEPEPVDEEPARRTSARKRKPRKD